MKKKTREESSQKRAESKKIDPAILDKIIKEHERPEQAAEPGGVLEQLKRRIYERMLNAEMSHYLGSGHGHAHDLALLKF